MLSVSLIERMYESGDVERVIRDLAANGLQLPLPLRVRLSDGRTACAALLLRRLVELTYGPTPLSRRMIGELLACQKPDGGFGDADRPSDALATAAAAAAFAALIDEHPAHRDDAVLHTALGRALSALAGMQQADGLIAGPADRTERDRELVTAFVMYLMGDRPAFRAAVRYADMVGYFEEHADRLETGVERLWALAGCRAEPDGDRMPAQLTAMPLIAA